nr:Na(+)/H(+) exchange regulatory cofactor NHE-RF1-like isoform X2 [Penaeus vannamei]
MSDIPDNAPAPRLCIITKWPDFEGYGFNLHAEKSKPGQYIGKVDAASPAELAGLLEGDRIVEVNGVNIANENHKQVVQRIKAVSNETRLLVLDAEADKYYKAKNIVVRGGQSNVVTKSSVRAPPSPATPEPPATNGHHQDDADARSVSSAASSSAASEASTQPQPAPVPEESARDAAREDEGEAAEAPLDSPPPPLPEEDDASSREGEATPEGEVEEQPEEELREASLEGDSLPPESELASEAAATASEEGARDEAEADARSSRSSSPEPVPEAEPSLSQGRARG